MEVLRLEDISEIIAGQSPPSETYNVEGIGLPFFQGKADFGELYPTIRIYCSKPNKIAKPNDILLSVRAPVGPTNLAQVESCIGRGLSAIRPNKKADTKFLLYYFRYFEKELVSKSRGSTFDAITQEQIRQLKVSLPDLKTQQEIAHVLEQADKARQQRKAANALTDQFLQSSFLSLFGDPVKNEKGWETIELNEVISSIDSGWSPVCEEDSRVNEEQWAVLKLSAVTYCRYNPTENKKLPDELYPKHSIEVKNGDLLFTRKNTRDLVAASAYVFNTPLKLLMSDTIFRLKYLEDKVSGLYLWYLLMEKNFRKEIQSLATGSSGSMPNISKEKLMKLSIPLPPLTLQQQFADIVAQAEQLRQKQRESERELENLFQGLLQRYFG